MINVFNLVQKGPSFVWVGGTVEQEMAKCSYIIFTQAERIEAVLKVCWIYVREGGLNLGVT